jgi:hypothetical protein
MAIKPHYALAAGLPLLYNAFVRRSLKPLIGLEVCAASAVVIAYALLIIVAFPAYLGPYLARLTLAYVPVSRTFFLPNLASLCRALVLLAALACLRLSNDRRAQTFATPWFLAALGGLGLFLSIGKWWSYTGYGMLAFAVIPLLCWPSAANEGRSGLHHWGMRLTALATVLACMQWLFVGPQFSFLTGPVASVAPPHPRLITISDNIAVGHPLVRALQGTWVGTSNAQVVAGGAIQLEQTQALSAQKRTKLDLIINQDRERLLDDVKRGNPDIIISDDRLFDFTYFDWWNWANQDPRLAKILAGYHPVGIVAHRFDVWKRNDLRLGSERMDLTPDGVARTTPEAAGSRRSAVQ